MAARMFRRSLSYNDALRLLGVQESRIIAIADRLAGAALAVPDVATLGALDLFAVRDELVKWGNGIVSGLRDRIQGLGRYDRTQRLTAAHTVIVITSLYEALDEQLARDGGPGLAAAALTRADQVALAGGTPLAESYGILVGHLVSARPPMPEPHRAFEHVLKVDLGAYFDEAYLCLASFLRKLSAFEDRTFDEREAFVLAALTRYEAAYRRLAADAPEFGVWAAMVDAQATRAAIEALGADLRQRLAGLVTGLTGVGELLRQISGGSAADDRRIALATRYRNRLTRPLLDVTEAPEDIVLPALADAYINPRGRIREAGPQSALATEAWWEKAAAVDDIQAQLVGYLTGPRAFHAPLVVLGQPGAGKSVLTQVLAARLPESDFLPIRVELRAVAADASIQNQIEEAIVNETGERISWPDLARSAPDALPVVMLDGFDELLQATGVNRADYLEQVREFQQRELELGRPVAVIVTTRTVVADRARCPMGTLALRLEPFDEGRVVRWLEVWNAANAAPLAARGLRPLPAEVVLSHGDLASQPLLVLMLALYDAAGNALQRAGGTLDQAALYERIFTYFAEREVRKQHPELPPAEEARAIDAELRRLGAVAVAMFNRGGQVLSEEEINADLPLLLPDSGATASAISGFGKPLTAAQTVVGRFFFMNESRANRDTGQPEACYEFLHATFGEFLVARTIVLSIKDLMEEAEFQQRRARPTPLDAGFLHAGTSFTPICSRTPVVDFCRGLLGRLPADARERCLALLVQLFRDAERPHPTWTLEAYEPQWRPVATRVAAYTLNLVLLIVATADRRVALDELFAANADAEDEWRRLALLWRSQLGLAWANITNTLRVTPLTPNPDSGEPLLRRAVGFDDRSDVRLVEGLPELIARPEHAIFPDGSIPHASQAGRVLRALAFTCERGTLAEIVQSFVPVWEHLGPNEPTYLPLSGDRGPVPRLLLELLLTSPNGDPKRRLKLYSHLFRMYHRSHQVLHRLYWLLRIEWPELGRDAVVQILRTHPHSTRENPQRQLYELVADLAHAGAEPRTLRIILINAHRRSHVRRRDTVRAEMTEVLTARGFPEILPWSTPGSSAWDPSPVESELAPELDGTGI